MGFIAQSHSKKRQCEKLQEALCLELPVFELTVKPKPKTGIDRDFYNPIPVRGFSDKKEYNKFQRMKK